MTERDAERIDLPNGYVLIADTFFPLSYAMFDPNGKRLTSHVISKIDARAFAAAIRPEPSAGHGPAVTIPYTNWRGEFAMRQIAPIRLYWGSNEWHPEAQWLLEAQDVVKGEVRTFALYGIGMPATPSADVVKLVDNLATAVWMDDRKPARAAVLDAFTAKDREIERLKTDCAIFEKYFDQRGEMLREAELARLKAQVPEELRPGLKRARELCMGGHFLHDDAPPKRWAREFDKALAEEIERLDRKALRTTTAPAEGERT